MPTVQQKAWLIAFLSKQLKGEQQSKEKQHMKDIPLLRTQRPCWRQVGKEGRNQASVRSMKVRCWSSWVWTGILGHQEPKCQCWLQQNLLSSSSGRRECYEKSRCSPTRHRSYICSHSWQHHQQHQPPTWRPVTGASQMSITTRD